jgi:hypothetical protein
MRAPDASAAHASDPPVRIAAAPSTFGAGIAVALTVPVAKWLPPMLPQHRTWPDGRRAHAWLSAAVRAEARRHALAAQASPAPQVTPHAPQCLEDASSGASQPFSGSPSQSPVPAAQAALAGLSEGEDGEGGFGFAA